MRITGGELCGRKIKVPKMTVRPTQEMVREALFSILATKIPGSRFLDLFAGSGAVGLEAWSRGAEKVCWVEKDKTVLSVLRLNVDELTDSVADVYGRDVKVFLKQKPVDGVFDVIYADPPYADSRKGCSESDAVKDLLNAVKVADVLSDDGVLVVEQRASEPVVDDMAEWKLTDKREYGQTALCFYCLV